MAEDRTTPWVAVPPGEHDWDESDGDPCPTPYMARVTWRLEEGRATPIGVELRSTAGETVTAVAWREVPVAKVIDYTRTALRGWVIGLGIVAMHQQDDAELERAKGLERGLVSSGRGPKPIYDDTHYRRVADEYVLARNSGGNPVRAVARAFAAEYPGVEAESDYRPKSWVRTARAKGLIPPKEASRG